MLGSFLFALSRSRALRTVAESSAVGQRISRRYVAGRTIPELIAAAATMNRAGVRVTVDYLGENVTNRDEALRSEARYHQLLDQIAQRGLDANISLKLTHLGLDVNESLAHRTVEELLQHAIEIRNFIRVDMESSAYTQRTIDLVRDLHRRPGAAGHIGTVLQAYLHRPEDDARLLCSEGIRIRLCKGAYREPPSVAYQGREEVDANYIKVARQILRSGIFHAMATHDEALIAELQRWTAQEGIPKSAFEFQMLHGVRRGRQLALAREGWGIRCYIPFGTEWYPYLMRRLAERPANVLLLARSYFQD